MKILDYYLVPKHARAKAWKWCLSHLPEDYVARHGRKLMVVALRWLKAQPGLLLPHTWNHCEKYQQWGTSHASFAALERKGLAEQRDARTCSIGFWHLTKSGDDFLANLEPCDRLGTNDCTPYVL